MVSYFTVSRATSSIVVTPSMTFRSPLRRSVIMPSLDRFPLQLETRRADENQLAQLVGDLHDFVEADAALVAGLVADLAAGAACGTTLLRLLGREADLDQRLRGVG